MKTTIDTRIQSRKSRRNFVTEIVSERFSKIVNSIPNDLFDFIEIIKITFHFGSGQEMFAHFKVVMKFVSSDFPKPEEIEILLSLGISTGLDLRFTEIGPLVGSGIHLKSREEKDIANGLIQAISKAVQQRIDSISKKVKFLRGMKKEIDLSIAD